MRRGTAKAIETTPRSFEPLSLSANSAESGAFVGGTDQSGLAPSITALLDPVTTPEPPASCSSERACSGWLVLLAVATSK